MLLWLTLGDLAPQAPTGRSSKYGNTVCMKCRHAGAYWRNAAHRCPSPTAAHTSLDNDTTVYSIYIVFLSFSVYLAALPHDLFLLKEASAPPLNHHLMNSSERPVTSKPRGLCRY